MLGKKVANCAFVMRRNFPEGKQLTFLDNFAMDCSTDSLYHREAFKLLLERKELFDGVNVVHVTGDNGTHHTHAHTRARARTHDTHNMRLLACAHTQVPIFGVTRHSSGSPHCGT